MKKTLKQELAPIETPTMVYFARHGKTVANKERFLAGTSETDLTDEGIQQAHDLVTNILENNIHIDRIISSPLKRARDTATIVANGIGINEGDIIIVNDLHERNGGMFQGQPIDNFYSADERMIARAGGETTGDLSERVHEASKQVKGIAAGGGNTLVIGHAEFYRMAIAMANHLPPDVMLRIDKPQNSKLTIYPYEPHKGVSVLFEGEVFDSSDPDWLVVGRQGELIEVPKSAYHLADAAMNLGTWQKSEATKRLRKGESVVVYRDIDDPSKSKWTRSSK